MLWLGLWICLKTCFVQFRDLFENVFCSVPRFCLKTFIDCTEILSENMLWLYWNFIWNMCWLYWNFVWKCVLFRSGFWPKICLCSHRIFVWKCVLFKTRFCLKMCLCPRLRFIRNHTLFGLRFVWKCVSFRSEILSENACCSSQEFV